MLPVYQPKYSITNEILKKIGAIEAAREVIENAPLIPAYEKRFQEDAILRTVHHGTHLEGNDLSLTQAQRVLEGEKITARDRDIQEVINYRRVIDYIDELTPKKNKPLVYSQDILQKIHQSVVEKILTPDQVGKLRTSQVVIRDQETGDVTFRPPPAVETPYLLEGFFEWLNSKEGRQVHPVIRAGIAHYVLVAIHPFVEGNGRTARAFATLIFFAEGYDIRRLFSLEEYYDRDAASYYQALVEVSNQPGQLEDRDLTAWLEYFSHGFASELARVKDEVRRLSLDSRMKAKVGRQIALSERQIKLMEYLNQHGFVKMSQAKKILPMVSEDTILRDLRDLIKKGIIEREGKTKGAQYVVRK